MTTAPAPEAISFRAEIRQLLNILIHSLYTDREIGDGFRYVPGGPALMGGDPELKPPEQSARILVELGDFFIAEHPVMVGDYLEFLNLYEAGC